MDLAMERREGEKGIGAEEGRQSVGCVAVGDADMCIVTTYRE